MSEIKRGIYRHYKGGEYRILSEALNESNKEAVIVYQDINDEKKIWVRPKAVFLEEVEIDGGKKPRFEFVGDDKSDSFENKYLRALADYQNLLKQSGREREDFVKYALADFLHNVLPVYDHLKLSMNGLSEDEKKNPWAQGVSHVLKQFKDVLSQHGIEEIKTIGEKFDHATMEALEGKGETVVKEVTPGYKLNGKIIRPAKVIVE